MVTKLPIGRKQSTRECVYLVKLVRRRLWLHDLDTQWWLDVLKIYLSTKTAQVCRSRLSNVRAEIGHMHVVVCFPWPWPDNCDIWTWPRYWHTQTNVTKRITTPHLWVVCTQMILYCAQYRLVPRHWLQSVNPSILASSYMNSVCVCAIQTRCCQDAASDVNHSE